jgi:hypothetical protein
MQAKNIEIGDEYATRVRSCEYRARRVRVLEFTEYKADRWAVPSAGVRVQFMDFATGKDETRQEPYGSGNVIPNTTIIQVRALSKTWPEYLEEFQNNLDEQQRQDMQRTQQLEKGDAQVKELKQYGISAQTNWRGQVQHVDVAAVLDALRKAAA